MEKNFRLFVKNLPINIDEAKVKDLFVKYVAVNKIDLKEKKNLDDRIQKFAFINITATEKKLHTCFEALNGERIDGFEISVELAKESFLDRLKREREENDKKKEASNVKIDQEFPKLEVSDGFHSASKAKHKKFFDFDLSSSLPNGDTEIKKNVKKEEFYKQDDSNYQNKKENHEKLPDISKSKKEALDTEKYLNDSKSNKIELNKQIKNKKISNKYKSDDQLNSSDNHIKPVINESEKKRLMSLKQKRQTFKAQEQTIRNALRSVDSNKSNKIIFDDDIDIENSNKNEKQVSNKSMALFDSDDENDNEEKLEWNEEKLEAKANLKRKLLKMQTNFNNDERFALDERFLDDDEDNENEGKKNKNSEELDIEDEKKWQLEILGNVLGKTIKPPMEPNNDTAKKQNKMIRYDPTASNHKDFEVNIEKPQQEKPAKKKKKKVIETKEEDPIPISKEIFYDVSENLVDSLKEKEGFSLLKSLGRNYENDEGDKLKPNGLNNVKNEANENDGSFKFNFNSKNPFKYDSSDDERDHDDTKEKNLSSKSNKNQFVIPQRECDRLFFVQNDSRFGEAQEFFKTSTAHEEDAFKHKRRGLKEIVRSKIRNNLKKKVPWNKKKIRKYQKN